MTERLTKVNAVNAPKLMNEVDVAMLDLRAMRPTAPVTMMLSAGVRSRGWMYPNTFGGRTPSRPMAYMRREPLACAANPEAPWATMRPATTIDESRLPPIVLA